MHRFTSQLPDSCPYSPHKIIAHDTVEENKRTLVKNIIVTEAEAIFFKSLTKDRCKGIA
jgi:hypothetical protein